MLPTEDLFVYVYVLVHDLMIAGAIAVPALPAWRFGLQRCRAAGHRRGAAPAGPAQRGRVPGRSGRRAPGRPVPGAAAPERGQPGAAGCGARSSSSGPRSLPGSPKTTASRWTPVPCRSSTRPGSAARTAGAGRATTWPPGSAATPRTPSGSTASGWPSVERRGSTAAGLAKTSAAALSMITKKNLLCGLCRIFLGDGGRVTTVRLGGFAACRLAGGRGSW